MKTQKSAVAEINLRRLAYYVGSDASGYFIYTVDGSKQGDHRFYKIATNLRLKDAIYFASVYKKDLAILKAIDALQAYGESKQAQETIGILRDAMAYGERETL